MTNKDSIAVTKLAGGQASIGATIMAGGQVDQAALRQAEQAVGFEWKPGDVILDLYEVRKVTEGFGEDAEEKDFHEGGFGRVYKVWHRTWRREMAAKTPRAGAFITQEQKDAFTRECETWVNLGLHAHIAACHYVRELGGAPRVFSEYAEAGTLEEWIRTQRLYQGDAQTALSRMLDASIQFAWGLQYAHERGVIHQDVKPLNALLWNDGTLKVTDFGLAGARQKVGLTDQVGAQAGGIHTIMAPTGGKTPAYCSPEQDAGRTLDRRTDVWSWAVSVMQIFQGEVTWQKGELAAQALEAFLEHNGEEEGIPYIPDGVANLLRQCFQPNPADRPRTLRDCATTLIEIYQAETGKTYPRTEPQVVGDTPNALNNRALSLLDLGKPDEAQGFFDRALEQDFNHLAATYNRGLMLWRTDRKTDVDILTSLEEIRKEHPDEASVECALGWVRMENADCAKALSHFEKAIELGDDTEARRGLEQARPLAHIVTGCSRTIGGHPNSVCSVTFSPDGRFVLSGGAYGIFHSEDKTLLRLWDVTSGRCLRTLEWHTSEAESVVMAFSPDCRFAISSSKNILQLWDVATGQRLRSFDGCKGNVGSVTFSPNSHFALSGSGDTYGRGSDNTLRLWDVATGQCLQTFEGHQHWVYAVAFSPDGRFVLSGSWDYTLRLWDVATGQCLRTFEGQKSTVDAVEFSPNGRLALSGSSTSLWLWDIATGECICTFEGHANHYIRRVAFSPDGRFVLSGSQDKTLRLWDVATGKWLRTFRGHSQGVNSVAFSPDGRSAISGSGDNTLRLWEVSLSMDLSFVSPWYYSIVVTAQEALDRQRSHEAHLSSARQALEAGRIAEALALLKQARAVPGFEKSPESLELQARAGARSRIKSFYSGWLKRTFEGDTCGVKSVAFSPDGRSAISGSGNAFRDDDKTLRLWDVATGKCLRTLEGHSWVVASVAFSPDGHFALSGSHDKTLQLWDVATGQCLRTFKGHTKFVASVAFSPDGRFALSGGWDKTLRLWDVATGKCLRTFGGHTNSVTSVAYAPDGRLVLSASSDKTLRLWDVATGKCLRTFKGHTEWDSSVVFSPDGHFALSGGGEVSTDYESGKDYTLRLWDVATEKCLRTYEGHTNGVNSVSFSPDSRFALSGSYDKTLRLWDVATGECLRIFEGHTGVINSVAFSPDSRFALSGSYDKTLRLWEIDWEYEYDPEYDPLLKHRVDEERKKTEEEAYNHSLRGRIANLFTGKGRRK